ncbi:MAG: hypothetical protein H7A37_02605 [Chlamydiales bacterium]|nr:hypothetical protein [Chlamydiia bacterium]MCP5507179.1 hypothetical protein [Chlamydiales bacterium]
MSRFEAYPITASFSIEVVKPKRRISSEMAFLIDEVWKKLSADNDELFNGSLLSFQDFNGSKIIADFAEYKLFLAQREVPELREWLEIRPISASSITMAADSYLVGQRSARVTTDPLAYELAPSGTIDDEADDRGKINLQMPFVKELIEETAIPQEMIKSVKPFLLVFDKMTLSWELCAEIIADDGVIKNFEYPVKEYKDLLWVPRKNMPIFRAGREDEFVPLSLFLLDYVNTHVTL